MLVHIFLLRYPQRKGSKYMPKKLFFIRRSSFLPLAAVCVSFITVSVTMIAFPQVCIKGAKTGLDYSLNILIPSLFPFMFLSCFAAEYGISEKLSAFLAPVTERLFHLPPQTGVTILLSLIGGYPVGAAGINTLYKQNKITQKQAERMLYFCVNPGPAFLVSVVGAQLYGSTSVGILLFCVQVITSVAVGIISGVSAKRKEPLIKGFVKEKNSPDFSASFVSACVSACTSTLNLCFMVILFSSLTAAVFKTAQISQTSYSGIIMRCIIEVTDGTAALAKDGYPIYLTALAAGWGGLCVHFQVFAALSDININKLRFFFSRLICGITSAAVIYIICYIIKTDIPVFSNFERSTPVFSSSTVYGSMALVTLSILFLIFICRYTLSHNDHE